MPTFADSFWTQDYASGLGVLFEKLQQGIVENEQVLTIARLRAEAEDGYHERLAEIQTATNRLGGGFQRDDGASLKKAYEGVRTEMAEASKNHRKVANNINELVLIPFSRWCAAHQNRVNSSQDDLQARLKAHDKQADLVRKLRGTYLSRCRQKEDAEEENKMAFQEPEKQEATSPKTKMPFIKLTEAEEPEPAEDLDIGDERYTMEQVKTLIARALGTLRLGEAKVPILGTYQNVSTGTEIVEYLQRELGATTVSQAERIGQDLIRHGFLRLIGSMGSEFANSSKMKYQWRPKAFTVAGVPETRGVQRTGTALSETGSALSDNSTVQAMGEMLEKWNPLNNPHPNETPLEKVKREARESEEKYRAAVRRLDLLRCNLEEAIIDHLRFMERCELDRLKAVKAVMLDFSGAISNVIPSMQSTVDNMMLYQESVQPLADLRYLIENYRTGGFAPKVQIRENYYKTIEEQTFGVEIEARARQDRKRVPIIVSSILTFLDSHYPDLDGDVARRTIWTVDVPLAATHHLRNSIGDDPTAYKDVFEKYELPIVASLLKLYLLELPDSLVASHLYEVIKTIYTNSDSSSSAETRITVLQSSLTQLPLPNIASLDAITTHFTRLIDLTSADEAFVAELAQTLAPCLLRPKTESSLTFQDRHPYRLVRDLFDHYKVIFGELKRASSNPMGSQTTPLPRNRAPSTTDESNRRANMEARARAIMGRSRASSPSPNLSGTVFNGTTRHRRERSTGGPETRFPIVTSPVAEPARAPRSSLDPEDIHATPRASDYRFERSDAFGRSAPAVTDDTNGNAGGESLTTPTSEEDIPLPIHGRRPSVPVLSTGAQDSAANLAKHDSLSRTTHAKSMPRKHVSTTSNAGGGIYRSTQGVSKRDSVNSVRSLKQREAGVRDSYASEHSANERVSMDSQRKGVELMDRPMDEGAF